MTEHEAAALLRTSHFRVLIGRDELGFAEVSPLSSEVDLERRAVRARRPAPRALARHDAFRVAPRDRRRQERPPHGDDPPARARGRPHRQLVAPRARLAYRWSGPTLNALESSVAFEEVELAYEEPHLDAAPPAAPISASPSNEPRRLSM